MTRSCSPVVFVHSNPFAGSVTPFASTTTPVRVRVDVCGGVSVHAYVCVVYRCSCGLAYRGWLRQRLLAIYWVLQL